MKMRWLTTAAMVAAIAFAPAVSFAADKSALPSGDKKFVMEALKGGMAEVELGKLASEKASNDAVKQFGQRMADDHAKAGDELKEIAADKGVQPPATVDG